MTGSPPHARGRLEHEPRGFPPGRITPACAGKTTFASLRAERCRDHPRMRGEDHSVAPGEEVEEGSPPHARGRPAAQAGRASACRITPACAGKTLRPPAATSRRSDHPRMRGEDMGIPKGHVASRGSPPHARGRRIAVCIAVCIGGITPACAGKTCCDQSAESNAKDHPRMRGEDGMVKMSEHTILGSPPHARGRHPFGRPTNQYPGITPACAGKTLM